MITVNVLNLVTVLLIGFLVGLLVSLPPRRRSAEAGRIAAELVAENLRRDHDLRALQARIDAVDAAYAEKGTEK